MYQVLELNEIIASSECINVYNDGEVSVYRQNETPYNRIVEGWKLLCENAREMPAFGVSLNNETIEARNIGLWVEFVFDKQHTHSSMTFEKLLVKVEKEWQGFNIFRYNAEGGYNGRCYFYDLVGSNMAQFYDILVNL